MKKTAIRALSLLFAASLLTAGLTGCTQELEGAELTKAYETAVQNALAEDVYYWKETKLKGKNTESCQVNVFAGQGSNYEPLRDENGAYSEYKINLQQTSSQPQKAVRIYCGLSQGKEKKDEAKNYLFTQTLEEGQIVSCVKQPMTAAEYYQSEAFAPYLLSSRIAELKELTVADMDFSIKDGQAEQKVNVTELIFKPTDAYLARYEQKYGKKSLFEGAKKVSIEIAYDRIAHIIVYAEEKLDSNLSVEIEQYKFEASRAEREGDYGKVAELRYGKIKEAEQRIEVVKKKLADMKHGESLIREEVTSDDIAAVVSKWTGIPVNRMMQSERTKLLHLEEELHKRVVGQEVAIAALADAVRRNRAGLQDARRPIGSFIFLGTTGVGKTELAKALAEFLFDDETMMTRIDMSEYQEKHSVSRLVGAPPGYVGYDEGGQLTEAIRRKPYSVVLFDEIEKAHPDVFNILLQVLDDGRLTDNKGRVVNFKNTIIIMTSNMGSSYIQSQMEKLHGSNKEEVIEETKKEVMNMLKKTIRPEFLNRIDETIMFLPLNEKEIKQIVLLQIKGVQKMLAENGVELKLTEGALDFLSQVGYDPEFGARPVKRAIQRYLLNDLSKKLLSQEVDRSKAITVDAGGDGLVFRN